MRKQLLISVLIGAVLLTACANSQERVLRVATTTSTYDSGLLDDIIPDFEARWDARVDILAVGTGQAIAIGERGDADVILVHNRQMEEEFVAEEYGLELHPVMYNDFVIVGPRDDPANVKGSPSASEGLKRIAAQEGNFASRGDDSGTHARELLLWNEAGIDLIGMEEWYNSLGQGMAETLRFANEEDAYTLTDRGTFLALQDDLPRLVIVVGGESIAENPDPALLNPYSVIAVNPARHSGIASELAESFIEWLCSLETQEAIGSFGVDKYGQPLFYPDSECYREAQS